MLMFDNLNKSVRLLVLWSLIHLHCQTLLLNKSYVRHKYNNNNNIPNLALLNIIKNRLLLNTIANFTKYTRYSNNKLERNKIYIVKFQSNFIGVVAT